jgi:hypothetical protein
VRRAFKVVLAGIAVGSGLIVLLGYFIENEFLHTARLYLLQWAVLLGGAALFLGLFNLLSVHWNKLGTQDPGWVYSAALILFFLLTLVLGLIYGPDSDVLLLLFNSVQVPVESSLMALLAVSLAVAGFSLIRKRRDLPSVVFVGTALLVLIGTGPWPVAGDSPVARALADLRAWITQVWAVAGARGVILGIALGAITTGLRVLMASDRPYGE